jgi:phage tail-like protein
VAEYRNGNDPENHVRKINGIYKVTDVTLKRGLIGATDFFGWIKDVRDGVQDNVRATVTIELQDEGHTGTVMTWILTNARPIKYTGPTLNAKGGTDVAMEELVLACEKIDIE